ncbi:short chain dehydrogenase [Mycobacterium tuberculosis CAS/NITR204]|uniref:Short chain dehydrogenase n=1 Tax=Mycobacterium tuberculosis CAS/NITR204 TaxID=1310114 RepID=R4MNI1_MYCTX|nr:short chain dehydrogenase [Mycobacterium tuberculosis CAS/NITR204]
MNLSVAPKEIAGHGLLDGKVVVVTAAAGTGIGSATARRALAEGADVVISDHHERRLGETAAELSALGLGRVEHVVCDVTSTAQVDALIDSTTARMGRSTCWSAASVRPVADMTDDEWDRVLDVSLTSVFRATRAALRYFRDQPEWLSDRQQRQRAGLAGPAFAVALCRRQGRGDGVDPVQRNRSRRVWGADQRRLAQHRPAQVPGQDRLGRAAGPAGGRRGVRPGRRALGGGGHHRVSGQRLLELPDW